MANPPNTSAKRTWKSFDTKIQTTAVFLDKKEDDFFADVKEGDIDSVKEKLNDANNRVDRDAINSDGKTAFEIAAENDNIPMIRELLKDIKDTELYSVLSQCVVSNNLDCIRKIISELPDKLTTEKNEIIKLINEASQLKHYEIVYFFIQNDYLIKDNDECTCSICGEKEGKKKEGEENEGEENDGEENEGEENEGEENDGEENEGEENEGEENEDEKNEGEKKVDECNKHLTIHRSQATITRFKVLTNPVYICLR